MEAVLHSCHDPEVPAAAAERPEQLPVPPGIDVQALPSRGHDLHSEQIVDRQPCLRTSQPMPPPRVNPAIPTDPVSPNPVARPCRAASLVYLPAVSRGWPQAILRCG